MKFAIIPLAFLVVCAWSMDRVASPVPDAPVPGKVRTFPADCLRGGDSTSVIPQGKSQTPSTWTPHQIDSLLKYLNIYTQFIGDTTGRYVQREVVERLLYNQHWRGRDSGFVFQGDECIRIELRLGLTSGVPDTLLWINLCQGNDCRKLMTYPIVCEELVTEAVETADSVRVCDTTCYKQTTYVENRKYYAWNGATFSAFLTQYHFGVCNPIDPGPGYYLTLFDGQTWRTWLSGARPITGPAQDSCYISSTMLAQFVVVTNFQTGPYTGMGPWYVDTNIVTSGQIPVDCKSYGQAGVVREIANCRWEYTPRITYTSYTRYTDLGRDTTIWVDTCGCWRPKFVCETTNDSIRHVRYVYERDVDTLKVPCEREYTYQTGGVAYYTPAQQTRCTQDAAEMAAIRANWHLSSPSPSVGKYRVTDFGTTICRSCVPTEDPEIPTLPGDSWWNGADIDALLPCLGDTCIIESSTYTTVVGPCCPKDSSITIYCFLELGELRDSVVIPIVVPDLTQPCYDSTIVGFTPGTDSTLIDSLVWFTPTSSSSVQVTWYDSCACRPTLVIAGRTLEWCDTLRIEWDCEDGAYWTPEGVLRIPCPWSNEDGADYAHIERITQTLLDSIMRQSDSLRILRHIADSIKNAPDTLSVISVDASAATYTVLKGTDVIIADATTQNLTVQLPASSGLNGYQVTVKRVDASANSCEVTVYGGETMDGAASHAISQYESITLTCDGSAWHITAWYTPPP